MNGVGTLTQLVTKLADEDSARTYLEKLRWPHGPVCPHCGSVNNACRLQARTTSKRPGRKGLHKCRDCRRLFTATVGTIFEDSHIPISKWLMAIYLLCNSKKGMSTHQLHRALGITYRSAWFMTHRLRWAMTEPSMVKLRGIIEADETYVGGKTPGSRGRNIEDKAPVFTLISRSGASRSFHVPRVTAKNLKAIIREHVASSATIMTDKFTSYRGLDQEYEQHQTVDHHKGEYARGPVHINTAESFFAILKRGLNGVYHHVGKNHLHRYLAEFDFRFSLRDLPDGVRAEAAIKGARGKRLMYKQVLANLRSNGGDDGRSKATS